MFYTASAQLVVDTSLSIQQLVDDVLVGNGISSSNITFSGAKISVGKFTGGNTTNIGIDEGILLTTGSVYNAIGPNNVQNKTLNTVGGSDPQLASLVPGYSVNDAAVIEFDFVPVSDTIKLKYVFASEEYPEWVGSSYNDVFGFFISGPNPSGGNYNNHNLALVPGTTLPVTVNNINNGPLNSGPCTNCQYYVNNNGGTTIQYDGFTTVLTAYLVVTQCASYHIKIAIGDVGDHSFDSGIFLKSNSFSTNVVTAKVDYSNQGATSAVEGCSQAIVSFKLDNPLPVPKTIHYSISGSATNGTDYTHIPDSVTFPANTDSVAIVINPLVDNITEGVEDVRLIIATSLCSWDTVDVAISDYTTVSVNINTPSVVCVGDSVSLSTSINGGAVPYSYTWNTGDTTSGITKAISSQTTYSVSVTDFCGSSAADSVVLTPSPPPSITVTASNDSICLGDSTNLSATGAGTYTWTPSGSLSSATGNSVSAFPASNTVYTTIGTDANGCKDSVQVSIYVKPAPTINTSIVKPNLCRGQSTQITASGGVSYQWTPTASLNQNTGATVIASPVTTTTYTITGTASNGCINTATATVNVSPLPNLSFNPSSPTLCIGQSKTLHVSGAQTYVWSPATYLSATTGSSVLCSPSQSISYTVSGTDANGCVSTDTLSVGVHNYPTISVNPDDTFICHNASVQLVAGGALNYSWSPSSGLSATSGDTVTASPSGSIVYTIIGTDSYGCSDTTTSIVNVSPLPQISTVNQQMCQGDTAILTASSAMAGTSFLWNTGSTNATISVHPTVSTTYTVTATDTNNCSANAQATVTVYPPPTISISPADPAICYGDQVQLTASGASSYSWWPSSGLSSTTGSTVTASPLSTTTYRVIGQNTNGCKDTVYITVTINPLPNIIASPHDTLVCINNTYSLNASGGLSYSWSPATYLSATTGSSVNTTPGGNITYIVTGTDVNSCSNTDTVNITVSPLISASAAPPRICVGDSTMLSVNGTGNPSYLWNTGSTATSFWVSPAVTTTYSVTATDTMTCTNTDSVIVIVDTLPIVQITPLNPDLCQGSSMVLTASGANTYVWSPSTSLSGTTGSSVTANPASTITYTVIGYNSQNCLDSAQTTIHVISSPTVTVNPANDTICYGDIVNLTASANMSGLSYQWTPASGLSSTSGSMVQASPQNTTNYKVVGQASNGCKDSTWAYILVNPLPVLQVNPDSTNLCIGDSVTLTATGAATYNWTPASSLSSATGSTVSAKPAASTVYTLRGTSNQGCIDSVTAYVGIHPYPVLSLSPLNPHMCPNDSVQLIAGGADNYQWSPATGLNTTSNDTVIAKPSQITTYQVIGSNNYGCSDTMNTTVSVSPVIQVSPASAAICIGDSVMLTVSSNTSSTTYVWNTGATSDTLWVSPLTTTTYTVTATDSTTCTNSASVTVSVSSIPILSISPANPAVCPGDSVSITATGANTYTWLPSNTLSSSTGSTVAAFPLTNTNYSVIGKSAKGCYDTLDFVVNVYSQPTVSVNPTSATLCGGLTQMLVASGTQSYQWSPSSGLNTTNNDTVLASPVSSVTYQVIGTDANGCRDTAQSVLTVYSEPSVSPSNPHSCPGDTTILSATGVPVQPLSWSWNTGATTDSILVHPQTTTTYTVTATYPGGCIKTSSRIVNIYNDPAVVATASDDSICPGDTTQLYGTNGISYTWQPAMYLLQTSGSSVSAVPLGTTDFIVRGLSVHNCPTLDTIRITVFPEPNVSATANPYLICRGDSAVLTATGGQTYLWTPSYGLSDTAASVIKASPDSSTLYTLTGSDANGCIDIDTVMLTVDPGPAVYVMPVQPKICQGDTVTLNGFGAISYQWTPTNWLTSSTGQTTDAFPPANTLYTMRGFDQYGCYNDTSVYVTVKRNPVIWVSPVLDSICAGDSIQITATGAGGNGTYLWTPVNGLSSSTGDSVWAAPAQSTTYKVTGVSTDGCSKSVTSTIKVFPYPNLTVQPSTAIICQYDSTTLKASGADFYQWSPTTPIYQGSATSDSIGVKPLTTTIFTLVGSTTHGCYDTLSALVNVEPIPQVYISADDTTICKGDTTNVHANGAQNYQWLSPGSLPNQYASNLNVNPTNSVTYILKGIDSNMCVNKDTFTLTVNPVPLIAAQTSDSIVCAGDQVVLTAQSNMSPTTFIWSTGDTTNSLSVYPQSTTMYHVTGYNTYGCTGVSYVGVQANPIPQLSLNTYDTIICDYDSVLLQASSSVTQVNYIWNTQATTPAIVVKPATNTTYTIIASDSIGCGDTAQAIVRIQPTPTVNVTSSNNPSCAGDSVSFYSNASGAVTNYLWNTMATTSNIQVIPVTSGYYQVLVTDSVGCVNKDSIYHQVNPIPQLTLNISANQICIGDSVQLSVTSTVNPVSYLWSTGDTLSSINRIPLTTTIYWVTGMDSIGCTGQATDTIVVHNLPQISFVPNQNGICLGDTLTISANSNPNAASWLWTTGSTNQSITVNPTQSTGYGVQIVDIYGCVDSAWKPVDVYPLPTLYVNPPVSTICSGDTVHLNYSCTHPVQSTLWSTGDTTAGIMVFPPTTQSYWAEIRDTNNCKASDTALINVKPRPSCIISASPDTICSIDTALIVYQGNGSSNATFNWSFDGGTVVSGSGGGNHYVQWNTAGYKLIKLLVTENGCTSYPDTARVQVFQTPNVDFAGLPRKGCENVPVYFQCNTPDIKSYSWDFGNLASNTDTSTLQNPSYTYSLTGLYSVSLYVMSNDNCPAEITKPGYIIIQVGPKAGFRPVPPYGTINDPKINFYDKSSGATSWLYDFNDPNSGTFNTTTDRNPWHEFSDTGLFRVVQIVENQYGCSDTAWQDIMIENVSHIYIPNAFTPNDDGLNDVFRVVGTKEDWESYEVFIYNRWGKLVFTSKNMDETWNGRENNVGEECPTGNYVVLVKVEDKHETSKRYTSNLILYR